MGNKAIGTTVVVALLFGSAPACLAQGSASSGQMIPDSNMGPPSGNTGAANSGIGNQGSLRGNAGSHASSLTGAAGAAQIPTSPRPSTSASANPKVESDPAQGGGQQKQ